MNKPLSPKDVTEPKVTTGPLSGSRKVYSSPEGHADLARAVARDRAEPASEPPSASTTRRGRTPTPTPQST